MRSITELIDANMNNVRSDRTWPLLATVVVAGILTFWTVYSVFHSQSQSALRSEPDEPVAPYTLAELRVAGVELHDVRIRKPDGPPPVVVSDPVRGEFEVSCTTCHATRRPDPSHGRDQALDEFHTELVFAHGGGSLGCLSCHDGDDYDSLRAADGRQIAYSDVMQLCAQCHSKQHVDYQHGAHGGKNGYWDLSRGPQTRHNCIDCHDPHAPAFPSMQPTFKPIDRGLVPSRPSRHK